jgi:hypothetical protein
MRFIVVTLIGTPPLLAAKWWNASHLRCVKAAKRPQGLGLDTYNSNYAVGLRCNTGSDGLHRMANMGDLCMLR